ncbi:MAG: hypothetical protein KF884_11745 [Fimbriimonadaceae bacterium]|nr:hypothetical protein [Fimbriimonadaceae bacterium]QYK58215.1 MAG: hypothetical protein KF884_11745 [Fimbriimonadaceae bacterium]
MRNLLLIAAVGAASFGSAQGIEQPVNLAVRLGWVFPINNAMRDVANNYIGVGVDYFTNTTLLPNGELTVSADWFGKSGSGAKGNVFPIMLNQRFYAKPRGEDDLRSYVFFGAGIAIVDINQSQTVLAGRVGYGVELGRNLFAEGTLTHSDSARGARATAAGIYIGYRF